MNKVTLTDNVTSIGENAFYRCTGLTSVNIPNSIVSIGGYAFEGCSGLTSVTIPNGIISIGHSAFARCSGLTSVTIPNSVTSIGGYALEGCSGLTSVTIPNSVTSISEGTFRDCCGLTSVDISNGIISIGGYAFKGCSALTSVDIPNSIVSIGGYAFGGCSSLTSVTIPNSVTSIGGYAFSNCSDLNSVSILCNLTQTGDDVFYDCKNIKEATFDCDNVTSLLSGIESLNKVTMTDKVTSIGQYAFYGCSSLTSVTIPNSVTTIGYGAFACGLKSVVIGSGVTSIGDYAFGSTKLTKTFWLTNTPPSGYNYAVGKINYVSNEQFNINNKIVYKFLSSYFDVDGIRYVPVSPSDKTCDAIDCVYNEMEANTVIHKNVNYKGVEMKVLNIQPYICYDNKSIISLDCQVDCEIPIGAFMGCSNLKILNLGGVKRKNGNDTGCFISPNISKIGDDAFNGCSSIKNVIMEDSESELNLGSNNQLNGYDMKPLFSDCLLDSVYIGRNINYSTDKNKGSSPFYRNTSLRAVKITDKETEISENEFYGCTNLQSVTIGDGVTTIGNWAFSGCSSLKQFAFGSHLQTIGKEAFSDCAAVTEISSKASTPPACGEQALDDINKWECKLYVPKGCLAQYQAADQWKDFFFTEEGEMSPNPEEPQTNKCKTPTIEYHNGMLKFNCETEGAVCQSTISDSDIKSYSVNEVQLGVTYTITVYASKTGYENSETATATLCWIDVEPKTEGITNSVASVRANPVLIQSSGSTLTISGADEGTAISVYDTSGRMVGSALASAGTTTIDTSLRSGEICILKIGEKSVKIMMK